MIDQSGESVTKPARCKSAMWGRAIPRKAKWKKRALLAVCAAILLSAGMAFADSAKISNDLGGKNGADQVDVIVQFNQAPTARYHQKVLSRGGKLHRELGLVKGGAYSLPASALADLAADPDVVYISPDRPLHGANDDSFTPVLDYHNETVNAPAAWTQGLNGAGIGVAVIDSGITDLPDLDNSGGSLVAYSQDFTGDPSGSATDQYGHGTHVAGIIAGTGAMSTGSNYS